MPCTSFGKRAGADELTFHTTEEPFQAEAETPVVSAGSRCPKRTAWVFDREGERQAALLDANVITSRADEVMKLTDKGVLERAAMSMRRAHPDVLWVRLFHAGTPRGTRRDKLACRATARLVRLQMASGRDVLVDGPPSNLSWELPEWQEVVQAEDIHSYVVPACRLDSTNSEQTKCGRVRVLTTQLVPGDLKCQCGRPSATKGDPDKENRAAGVRRLWHLVTGDRDQGARPESEKTKSTTK